MQKFDLTIIAGGDSLRGFDFSQIPGEVWAINWAAKHMVDLGVKPDRLIHFDKFQQGYPTNISTETIVPHFGEWFNRGEYINREPGCVGNLNSSMIFAVNVALNKGYRNIVVLGADQRGCRHWYDPIETNIAWNFDLFETFLWLLAEHLKKRPGEMVTLVESAAKRWPRERKISMEQYKNIIGYVK